MIRVIRIVLFIMLAGFSAVAGHAAKTVIIDAGHGGHDRGGIPGQRVAEKEVALDVAKRVERNLKRAGFTTVMTRTRDVFVPLSSRVAISNRRKGAIFVSIHFNSARRVGAKGFETFYYGSGSYGLAAKIQASLLRAHRTENRGVKRRGFYVLRRNRNVAVLVECGFLTNPAEARLARGSRHRQRLADAISKAIIDRY